MQSRILDAYAMARNQAMKQILGFGRPRGPLYGLNHRLANRAEEYIKCGGCNELRDPHLFHSYNGKLYLCVYCIEEMNNDLKEVM